jgi:hypothetical protein
MKYLLAIAAVVVFALVVGVGDDLHAIPGYHKPASAIGYGA